jgi:hypothetical protein
VVKRLKATAKEKLALRHELRENPSLSKELVNQGYWTEKEITEVEAFRTKWECFKDWMPKVWYGFCAFTRRLLLNNAKRVLIVACLAAFAALILSSAHSCFGGEYIRLQDVYRGN